MWHGLVMGKLLIHIADGDRRVVDADSVYYAEAVGGDTLIRRRSGRPMRDVRELGEIERAWKRHGFVRIHVNHLVNAERVLRIRKVDGSRNWEVKMAPPVNAVLPVGRRRLSALWGAFE